MRRLAIIAALPLMGLSLAYAASAERNSQPIQIKSDQLVTDSAAKTATFSGKVSARQGDVTIFSDKVVISYGKGNEEVEKVEAFGNVRILQGNRRGEAGHASYDNRGGKIVLDGSPKVFQGEDVIAGKVITYFLDDQRSIVTGGPETRVQATIHPKEKGNSGSAKP